MSLTSFLDNYSGPSSSPKKKRKGKKGYEPFVETNLKPLKRKYVEPVSPYLTMLLDELENQNAIGPIQPKEITFLGKKIANPKYDKYDKGNIARENFEKKIKSNESSASRLLGYTGAHAVESPSVKKRLGQWDAKNTINYKNPSSHDINEVVGFASNQPYLTSAPFTNLLGLAMSADAYAKGASQMERMPGGGSYAASKKEYADRKKWNKAVEREIGKIPVPQMPTRDAIDATGGLGAVVSPYLKKRTDEQDDTLIREATESAKSVAKGIGKTPTGIAAAATGTGDMLVGIPNLMRIQAKVASGKKLSDTEKKQYDFVRRNVTKGSQLQDYVAGSEELTKSGWPRTNEMLLPERIARGGNATIYDVAVDPLNALGTGSGKDTGNAVAKLVTEIDEPTKLTRSALDDIGKIVWKNLDNTAGLSQAERLATHKEQMAIWQQLTELSDPAELRAASQGVRSFLGADGDTAATKLVRAADAIENPKSLEDMIRASATARPNIVEREIQKAGARYGVDTTRPFKELVQEGGQEAVAAERAARQAARRSQRDFSMFRFGGMNMPGGRTAQTVFEDLTSTPLNILRTTEGGPTSIGEASRLISPNNWSKTGRATLKRPITSERLRQLASTTTAKRRVAEEIAREDAVSAEKEVFGPRKREYIRPSGLVSTLPQDLLMGKTPIKSYDDIATRVYAELGNPSSKIKDMVDVVPKSGYGPIMDITPINEMDFGKVIDDSLASPEGQRLVKRNGPDEARQIVENLVGYIRGASDDLLRGDIDAGTAFYETHPNYTPVVPRSVGEKNRSMQRIIGNIRDDITGDVPDRAPFETATGDRLVRDPQAVDRYGNPVTSLSGKAITNSAGVGTAVPVTPGHPGYGKGKFWDSMYERIRASATGETNPFTAIEKSKAQRNILQASDEYLSRVGDSIGVRAQVDANGVWRRADTGAAIPKDNLLLTKTAEENGVGMGWYVADKDVADKVRRFATTNNLADIPDFWRNLGKVTTPLMTTMRPMFVGRNTLGNAYRQIQEGEFNPVTLAKSFKAIKAMEKANRLGKHVDDLAGAFNVGGVQRGVGDILGEAENVGAISPRGSAPQTVWDIKSGGTSIYDKVPVVGKWNRFWRQQNATSENTSRLASYLNAIDEGVNPEAARKMVDDTLFNYDINALTVPEQWARAAGAPFYTWSRRNIPAQLKSFRKRPAQLKNIVQLQTNLSQKLDAEGQPQDIGFQELKSRIPDYMAGEITAKPGNGYVYDLSMPQSAVFNLGLRADNIYKGVRAGDTPRVIEGALGGIWDSLYPEWKIAAALGTGLDEYGNKVTVPSLAKSLPLANLAGAYERNTRPALQGGYPEAFDDALRNQFIPSGIPRQKDNEAAVEFSRQSRAGEYLKGIVGDINKTDQETLSGIPSLMDTLESQKREEVRAFNAKQKYTTKLVNQEQDLEHFLKNYEMYRLGDKSKPPTQLTEQQWAYVKENYPDAYKWGRAKRRKNSTLSDLIYELSR